MINAIADAIPQLLGGSADLVPSNNTYIKSSADFQFGQYQNRNIHYGIREHAMGSAMNGMALYGGVIPFGGTFQTFSDYMRPAIRLAALSHIQTIFVFTHDSIGLGEDGPTHQSVEHLAAMRAIPNLAVIRPCDAHETREAWRAAIKRQHAPTAFALSRQKVDLIDRKKFADAKGLHKGAYVLAEAETKAGKPTAPKLIIIATGSEVGLAMEARTSSMPRARRPASSRCRAGNSSTLSPTNTKKRFCPQRSPPASRSRPAFRRAGTNTSATKATRSRSTALAHPHPAKTCFGIMGLRLRM